MKKILLVFGAGGSLGKDVVKVFLKKNFDQFYLFDSIKLRYNNDKIVFYQTGDLTKEENVVEAFSKINFEKNAQYYLFSTIGGFGGGNKVGETKFSDWQKMFDINVTISFLIAKQFFISVKESKGGAICFTSAMTSYRPQEGKIAYGTSKSALNYLVKTLVQEGKNFNISINAIAPSILDTRENKEWVKDKSMMIRASEIGELVFSLFMNRNIVSGNIIELPFSLSQE
ncbi:MAG: SDR family oxidoreductase [Melioribacteraceae bacterium]|nr:SDR family oxidoreductase [Melioribacteraceae bacterium]